MRSSSSACSFGERAADALEALDALLQLVLPGGVDGRGLLEARDALAQLGLLAGVLGRADLVADLLELLARLVDLALGLLGAVAAGLRLAAGLLERGGEVGGGLLEVLDALERGEQARDDGGGVVEVGDRVALDAGIGIHASPRPRRPRRRGAPRARRARRRPTGSASSGRKATSVPAVRQPSHGCGSVSSAPRSARTTTGCCWRMRMSIRLRGSSKDEVLEEEREVEALVELDRDEDHLERERPLVGGVGSR